MLLSNQLHSSFMQDHSIKYYVIMPPNPQKVCLWLHGYQEIVHNLIANSNLEKYANEHHIAILLPQMPGKYLGDYYFNRPWQDYYVESFLVQEFLPAMVSRYQLPYGREHTYIAGISMGGFGSLLLGSHFSDVFSKIVSISGAFIINDVTNNNYEVTFNDFEHFEKLFGYIPSLRDCPYRNPEIAAQEILQSGNHLSIFMACGVDDMLHKRNITLRDTLENLGADITWYEHIGNHEWSFFNLAIGQAFSWLKE